MVHYARRELPQCVNFSNREFSTGRMRRTNHSGWGKINRWSFLVLLVPDGVIRVRMELVHVVSLPRIRECCGGSAGHHESVCYSHRGAPRSCDDACGMFRDIALEPTPRVYVVSLVEEVGKVGA